MMISHTKLEKLFLAIIASLFGIIAFFGIYSLISFSLGDYETAEVIVYDKNINQTESATNRFIYTKVNNEKYSISVSEYEYSTISVGSMITVKYVQGYYGQTFDVRLINQLEEE